MLNYRIGGLPVVDEAQLVGIITRDDILAQLVEALGGETASLRVTVQVPDRPGQFAKVSAEVAALGCNISSVFSAQAGDQINLTMRLEGDECERSVQAIQDLEDIDVIHVWRSPQSDEPDD
jgi:acetoin utilization protein AcuB